MKKGIKRIKTLQGLERLIKGVETGDEGLNSEFRGIVLRKVEDYGVNVEGLGGLLNDITRAGCISGIVGEFIYNSDCKEFYIKWIDELEEMREEMEEQLGERISNRHEVPHHVFICWLCFKEYCYNLQREIFED